MKLIVRSRCFFSTSPRLNLIPPPLWAILKPISKLGVIAFGRSLRVYLAYLRDKKSAILARNLKIKLITAIVLLSVLSVIYYRLHVKETPITRRKRFIAFDRGHLAQITSLGLSKVLIEVIVHTDKIKVIYYVQFYRFLINMRVKY